MTEPRKSGSNYPDLSKIRPSIDMKIIILALLLIPVPWIILFTKNGLQGVSLKSFLSLLGLTVDAVGVIFTLASVPYYGSFWDGGDVEKVRKKVLDKWVRSGLLIILIGFVLQGIGSVI